MRTGKRSHSSIEEHNYTPNQKKPSCKRIVRKTGRRAIERGWNSPSYPPPEQKATPISTCFKALVCIFQDGVSKLFLSQRYKSPLRQQAWWSQAERALELRVCILCESESHMEGMTLLFWRVSLRLSIERKSALVDFCPLDRSMTEKLFEGTKYLFRKQHEFRNPATAHRSSVEKS